MATHKIAVKASPPAKERLVQALFDAEREFYDAHFLRELLRTEEARQARCIADLNLRAAECALESWLKNAKGRGERT